MGSFNRLRRHQLVRGIAWSVPGAKNLLFTLRKVMSNSQGSNKQ